MSFSKRYISNRRSQHVRFPWVMAFLLWISLLGAEHFFPKQVMDGGDVDFQIGLIMTGSQVRELCYSFIGVSGFIMFLRRRPGLSWASAPLLILAGLSLWCLLSVCWAEEPLVSGRHLLVFALMTMGAAGFASFWTHKIAVVFIALGTAFHLGIGLIGEIADGHFRPWETDYRFAGTLYWNEQGLCCLFLSLSSLAASDMAPKYRSFFRLLFAYGCTFVVLTKSRSSLIGLATGVVTYFFQTRSGKFKILSALAVASAVVVGYFSGLLQSITAILSRNGEGSENLTGRIPLWRECWDFAKLHILVGYGYEDFWTVRHIDYLSSQFHWAVSAAHSGYLEAILTLGLVGLLLHLTLLMTVLCSGAVGFRSTHDPVFALASCLCVVYLVVGALEAVLAIEPSPVSFYFMVLIFIVGLGPRSNKQL